MKICVVGYGYVSKDLWLDGDEVVIRLKKMGKFEVDKQLSLELGEEDES